MLFCLVEMFGEEEEEKKIWRNLEENKMMVYDEVRSERCEIVNKHVFLIFFFSVEMSQQEECIGQ